MILLVVLLKGYLKLKKTFDAHAHEGILNVNGYQLYVLFTT